MKNRIKIKVNSTDKLEELLQEVYNDIVKQQNLIYNKIAELENSTSLKDETLDQKAKYSKAIHDYITDNEKIIQKKIEVSKLLNEILKAKGDVDKVLLDSDLRKNVSLDDELASLRQSLDNNTNYDEEGDDVETYITKTTRKK